MTIKHKHFSSGFTLIELGIVLIILSLMTSAILSIVNQNIRLAKEATLKERMDKIEAALLSFRKIYGYLPCPADITLSDDSANFGIQAANAGTCVGGTPEAGWDDSIFNTYCQNVGGAVPVVTLGLPTEYAYDPWNGRFMYFIDRRATSSNGFARLGSNYLFEPGLYIQNSFGIITMRATLALASMGPNSNGAYQSSGNHKDPGTNAEEIVNSRGNEDPSSPGACAVFYSHSKTIDAGDQSNVFDDTVRFYSKSFFYGNSDRTIEKY